jgi:hypothetical protein
LRSFEGLISPRDYCGPAPLAGRRGSLPPCLPTTSSVSGGSGSETPRAHTVDTERVRHNNATNSPSRRTTRAVTADQRAVTRVRRARHLPGPQKY